MSYGTAFKAPTLGQLYGAGYTVGNPDLQPETSRNLELAFSGQVQALNWRVSAYRNQIDNLIDYDVNQYRNIEAATIKGIETEASFSTAAFMHTLSFDYLDPTRSDGKQSPRRAKHNFATRWISRLPIRKSMWPTTMLASAMTIMLISASCQATACGIWPRHILLRKA